MSLIDAAVATLVLGGAGGVLAARAVRSWIDFRIQQRSLELLKASVERLELESQLAGRRPEEPGGS
jgi:hypothetical protein